MKMVEEYNVGSNLTNLDDLMKGLNIRKLISGVDFTVDLSNSENFIDEEEVDEALDTAYLDNGLVNLDNDANFNQIKEKMQDIRDDGKLKKLVLREGQGPYPENSPVSLHYVSYLQDCGTPFDSSYMRSKKPIFMRVETGSVYEGFELAVKSMKVGEVSVFSIHPDLAFKSMGIPPRIPPNSFILIEIELHNVHLLNEDVQETNEGTTIHDKRSFEQVRDAVKQCLTQGNNCFINNAIIPAIASFRKGEKILWSCRLKNDQEEEKWKNMLLKIYLNLCVCYNHKDCNRPKVVCMIISEALGTIPELANRHPKILFQMGKAKLALENYKDAEHYFMKAMKLVDKKEEIEVFLEKARRKVSECNGDKDISFSPKKKER